MNNHKILLVGDNPFHGVSHLSQSRARSRNNQISNPDYCAELIKIATENGADGFMFSVSDFTLNIVSSLSEKKCPPNYTLSHQPPRIMSGWLQDWEHPGWQFI